MSLGRLRVLNLRGELGGRGFSRDIQPARLKRLYSLRKKSESCHPERSEGSALREMLRKQQIPRRFAPRNDASWSFSANCLAAEVPDF